MADVEPLVESSYRSRSRVSNSADDQGFAGKSQSAGISSSANDKGISAKCKRKLKKRTRRGGKKHTSKNSFKFSIMGNNVAGLVSKESSLRSVIQLFNKPSCITLQETKLGAKYRYDIENYKVFQKNRNSSGGGLLTAVVPDLNPTEVSTEIDDAEILVVQFELGTRRVRLINGYGPQDTDTLHNRLTFWLALEVEITAAKAENCNIIIQMDANSKVGRDIIADDPYLYADSNGQQLLDMVERNNLIIINTDSRCAGAITRYR